MKNWRDVSHFRRTEFAKPEKMKTRLIMRLDRAREYAGVPFIVTSSYREGDDGAHGKGWAVDLHAHDSRARFKIVKALLKAGFNRIGVYDRHVHADLDPDRDEQVMWWGKSS